MTLHTTSFLVSVALAGFASISIDSQAAPPGAAANPSGPGDAAPRPSGNNPGPMPQMPVIPNLGSTLPRTGGAPEKDWGIPGGVAPGIMDASTHHAVDKTYGPTSHASGDPGQAGFTVMPLEFYGEGEQIGATLPPTLPEFHTVGTGDTLWGISTRYYSDPYQWPKLWARNGQITNANWIFPGDQIRLRDPMAETITFAAPVDTASTLHFGTTTSKRPELLPQYVVNRFAFIDEKEFASAMRITGGAQAKVMMSVLDTAYIGYKPTEPPVAGERLAVYEIARPIYDVRDGKDGTLTHGKRVGYLVEVVGEVNVRSVAPKAAEVRVVDSIRPIERGMRVGELRNRFARVRPLGSTIAAKGRIVDSIDQDRISGEQHFLIVNIGQKDGLTRGNILDVIRRGDEFSGRKLMGMPNEAGHPRRMLGELLVLEVRENFAITLAVNATQELVVGDHVEIGNLKN